MSNRASALIGKLPSLIVWAVVVWGELVGNVHAFRQHGVRDGLAALFVPPWSWYRGMEFFWHKPKAENETIRQAEYPALNAAEESVVSRTLSKAMREPLTEDDLTAYRQVLSKYATTLPDCQKEDTTSIYLTSSNRMTATTGSRTEDDPQVFDDPPGCLGTPLLQ